MAEYHNKLLFAVEATNSRVIVYLKQDEESGEYCVKVRQASGIKYIAEKSHSLSTVMREFAESIAQYTDGFTTWRQLS